MTMRMVIVLVIWKLLKSQENRKAKICLSPKNRQSQEKICQKVGIYSILTLKITG